MNPLLQFLMMSPGYDPLSSLQHGNGLDPTVQRGPVAPATPIPNALPGGAEAGLQKLQLPAVAPPAYDPLSSLHHAPPQPDAWKMFGGTPPAAGGQTAPGAAPAPAAGPNPAAFLGAEAKGPGQPGAMPGYDRPSTGGAGVGRPGAGIYSDSKSGTADAFPPTPAGNPFQAGFVDTSGVGGIYRPEYANSPEERLAALAERVANKTQANLLGTGVNSMTYQPVGMPEMLAANEQGQKAAADFMKAGLQSQRIGFEGGENQANRQNDLLKQILTNQGAAGAADITARGHVEGSRLAADAHTNPAAIKGSVLATVLPQLAMNPNLDPKVLDMVMQGVDEINRGSHGPAATPFNPVTPKGDGTPAPPPTTEAPGGGAVKGLGHINRANQALTQLAPLLGEGTPEAGKFKQRAVGTSDVQKFLTQLHGMNLSDPEFAAVMDRINGGSLGPVAGLRKPLATVLAGSQLRLEPPVDPNSKKPIGVDPLKAGIFSANPQFPGQYDIPDALKLQVDRNAINIGGGGVLSGGIPYNQGVFPSGAVEQLSPNDIRAVGRAGLFTPRSPEELKILNAAARRVAGRIK